jgi:hypothetical protein
VGTGRSRSGQVHVLFSIGKLGSRLRRSGSTHGDRSKWSGHGVSVGSDELSSIARRRDGHASLIVVVFVAGRRGSIILGRSSIIVAIVDIVVHRRVSTVLSAEAMSGTVASSIIVALEHVLGIGSNSSIGIESVLPGKSKGSSRANDGGR